MVIPKSTNTIAMLMVDVIFAFKNRAVDTFFFFDIEIEMELNSVCYFFTDCFNHGFSQNQVQSNKIIIRIEIFSSKNAFV